MSIQEIYARVEMLNNADVETLTKMISNRHNNRVITSKYTADSPVLERLNQLLKENDGDPLVWPAHKLPGTNLWQHCVRRTAHGQPGARVQTQQWASLYTEQSLSLQQIDKVIRERLTK